MSQRHNSSFQALADPTRRAILEMLSDGDKSAGVIAERFHISAPSVSHHLRVLKEAGLVITERQGQSIVYSLNTTVVQEVVQEMMRFFAVGGPPPTASQKEEGHA